MNKPKLAAAADALLALVETREFTPGYAHEELYISGSDLTCIAEMLRDQSEEAEVEDD